MICEQTLKLTVHFMMNFCIGNLLYCLAVDAATTNAIDVLLQIVHRFYTSFKKYRKH